MTATAHIAFVPVDETFVPKAGTAASVASLLDGLFAPYSPTGAGDTRINLVALDGRSDLTQFGADYLPLYAAVEQFDAPIAVEDDVAQRICGSCGALVP